MVIAFVASTSFVVGTSTAAAPGATALSACKAISKLANSIPANGKRSKKRLKSYARARQKLSAAGVEGAPEIALLMKAAKGAAAQGAALARAAVWCGPILAAGASSGETTTTQPPATSSPARKAKREYPAHGPSDPMFPTDDKAYDLLLTDCTTLLNKAQTEWPQEGINEAQGKDTVSLYESAADVCLGRWDDAIRTFATINTADPELSGTIGSNDCARKLVLQWVSALIDERKKDPTFSPVFVESSSPKEACQEATSTSDEQTSTTTTPTTSTSTR
jgi:hypothetical protein